MSSLSAYLAKNYLNASNPSSSDLSERPKKRRKKAKSAAGASEQGLVIADDDDDLMLSGSAAATTARRSGAGDDDGDDDEVPQMYDGRMKSAEFRKKKTSGWQSVSDAVADRATSQEATTQEQEEADRIIAAAQAADDERRREVDDEDAPTVVEDGGAATAVAAGMRMESGVRAGLQTAADTAKLAEREERERRAEERKARKERKGQKEEETVYRDATGRRIDVSMKRQEARQKEVELEKARRREREDAMGDVQRAQKEDRQQQLDDAKFLSLARGEDDEEMNDRLKEVIRWDDPMAAYMAQKQQTEEGDGGGAVGGGAVGQQRGVSGPKKKIYSGAAPPNRYGILPGWRWDGVDRGNGFEKEWFQARSRTKRNEDMSYQWQMDE